MPAQLTGRCLALAAVTGLAAALTLTAPATAATGAATTATPIAPVIQVVRTDRLPTLPRCG